MVEVTVHEVYQQQNGSNAHTVVVLKARDKQRYLPIWIGFPEAVEIAQQLQGLVTDRPTTYHLMAQLVDRMGAQVHSIHIASLEGVVYHATLRLKASHGIEEVDCRPSDALALATATGAPISVEDKLLEAEGCDSATAFHRDSMGTLHPLEFKEAA